LRRRKTTLLNIFPHGKQKTFPVVKIASHQLSDEFIQTFRIGWHLKHTTEKI